MAQSSAPDFSLLGGPLHSLGVRLGIVRGGNTVGLGVLIGLSFWLVLIALAFVQGINSQLFSLSLVSGHVRLLLVIPLLFFCESIIDPRCREFVHSAVRSAVLPQSMLPQLQIIIASMRRWSDSWLPEMVCLLAAILVSIGAPYLHLFGLTSTQHPEKAGHVMLASQWYFLICLPLFRFLLIRFLLRLGLWWYFLWRISRLPLRLVPTHPDGCAGLGYLEVVHMHLMPLVLALSVLQCASFAEEISAGLMAFEAIYPALVLTLLVDAMLVLGPLLLFTAKLWSCRVQGLSDYMDFASDYVDAFDVKWLANKTVQSEPLLGTPDLQSLADLGNSIKVVREMSLVPFSRQLLIGLVVAALLPMSPLLLFKYPAYAIAEKLLTGLFGL